MRLDAVKHLPLTFWARFNADLQAAKGGELLRLGELLEGDPSQVARTWQQGGFDALFDFPLGFALTDVFCRGQSPARLAAVLTNDRRYPDPARLVTLVDNHDLPRLASQCEGDQQKMGQALTFLTATRGIPSIIWGTEVGLAGAKEPDNRKSMRFVDHPLKALLTEAMAARRTSPALSQGAVRILYATADAVVIGQASADQLAVIVVNRGGALKPELPSPWSEVQGAGEVGPGVFVWRSKVVPGRWADFAARVDTQWRTGGQTRSVMISSRGPGEAHVAGSGPELGDWKPQRAPKLPVTLELPVGGVFELKRVVRQGDGWTWDDGDNRVLFVGEGRAPIELAL